MVMLVRTAWVCCSYKLTLKSHSKPKKSFFLNHATFPLWAGERLCPHSCSGIDLALPSIKSSLVPKFMDEEIKTQCVLVAPPQSELRYPDTQNMLLLTLPLPSRSLCLQVFIEYPVCAQLWPVQKQEALLSLSDLLCCSKFKKKQTVKKVSSQSSVPSPCPANTSQPPSSTPETNCVTSLHIFPEITLSAYKSMCIFFQSCSSLTMVSPKCHLALLLLLSPYYRGRTWD